MNILPRIVREESVVDLLQVSSAPPGGSRKPIPLSSVAYENHHAQAFHSWLNLSAEQKFEALRDRYVFYSVCAYTNDYLKKLTTIDLDRAESFVVTFMVTIRQLATEKYGLTEDWFRGLDVLVDALADSLFLGEAREIVSIGFDTGVARFPRSAQSFAVHEAYLDALVGNRSASAEVALKLIQRPYLLPNRRELPKLYIKLMYVLAASGHIAEYKAVLWRGISSLHATGAQRDTFSNQIVKTYRGAWRALLCGGIPFVLRSAFLLGAFSSLLGRNPVAKALRLNMVAHGVHWLVLYLLDFRFRRDLLTLRPRMSRPRVASAWHFARRRGKRRILVTRAMGGLGDILMMTPGLLALTRRYPKSEVFFATQKAFHAVVQDVPGVRLLDIQSEIGDLVDYKHWINLTDCPAGRVEGRQAPNVKKNRTEIFAKAMGISTRLLVRYAGFSPIYKVSPDEQAWAVEHAAKINPNSLPMLGVQPFAADSYRNWPHMEEFVRQAARTQLVLLFHHEPLPGFNFPNVVKVLQPIRKSVALASVCDKLVVLDSSFLHFAAALGVPTVVIFGAISGKLRVKRYSNVSLVAPEKSEFPCYPCWRHEYKPCHLSQGRESVCLRSIPVARVAASLSEVCSPNHATFGDRLISWISYGPE